MHRIGKHSEVNARRLKVRMTSQMVVEETTARAGTLAQNEKYKDVGIERFKTRG